MKAWILLSLFFGWSARAHVPALLLPLKGTPITSYFLGQSDVSRAVYSELTKSDDFFVVNFQVKAGAEATVLSLLTPVCDNLPQYEKFQPSALLVAGELPWKNQGEDNVQFIERIKKTMKAEVSSSFELGKRPKFFERYSNQYYWVGGEWRGRLDPGLYSVLVFDSKGGKGNFTLGLNEKEAWTPDLFKYAGDVVREISAGLCRPQGFTGRLNF